MVYNDNTEYWENGLIDKIMHNVRGDRNCSRDDPTNKLDCKENQYRYEKKNSQN